jgi:hypothetical protein
LHGKASDEVIRDTLYREFKRFGDISVKVVHEPDERLAFVYFRSAEDAREAKHSKSRIIIYDKPVVVEAAYESTSTPATNAAAAAAAVTYNSRSSSHHNSPPPPIGGGGGPIGGGGKSHHHHHPDYDNKMYRRYCHQSQIIIYHYTLLLLLLLLGICRGGQVCWSFIFLAQEIIIMIIISRWGLNKTHPRYHYDQCTTTTNTFPLFLKFFCGG